MRCWIQQLADVTQVVGSNKSLHQLLQWLVGSSKSLHQLLQWLVGSNNLHAFYRLLVQGGEAPPVQLECKMHVGCWIQQVTATVGAVTCWIQQVTAIVGVVTCWIQQPVYFKYVVGFSNAFNSEVDELIRKVLVSKDGGQSSASTAKPVSKKPAKRKRSDASTVA